MSAHLEVQTHAQKQWVQSIDGSACITYACNMNVHTRQVKSEEVRFSGIGGECMQAEGLQTIFPMTDLAVMGLLELIPHLPRLAARLWQTVRAIVSLSRTLSPFFSHAHAHAHPARCCDTHTHTHTLSLSLALSLSLSQTDT